MWKKFWLNFLLNISCSILLQNIHLVARWLGTLEKLLEQHAEGSHGNFRVFVSAEPSSTPEGHIIPQGILENSIKITNEPPTGMHANLHKALDNFNQVQVCGRRWSSCLCCLISAHVSFSFSYCFLLVFPRIPWKCALVSRSLRASSSLSAISTLWWLRGESLDLRAGTDRIHSTLETSPSPSTSSTTTWRPIPRLNVLQTGRGNELNTNSPLFSLLHGSGSGSTGSLRWPEVPVWWDHVRRPHHRWLGPSSMSNLPGGVHQTRDDGRRTVPGSRVPSAWELGLWWIPSGGSKAGALFGLLHLTPSLISFTPVLVLLDLLYWRFKIMILFLIS